jgi:predicted nicotinamide N-methyase
MATNALRLNEQIKKKERLSVNPSGGKFTLKRNDMRHLQDMKLCAQFCDWITELSGGIEVNPDTFVEDLSDGVALLRVVQKFGQVGVVHEYPKPGAKVNAFKARENRLEFIRACSRMDIHALPDVEFSLHSLIPCLLELAAIAESFTILEKPNKTLPDGIRRRVSTVLMESAVVAAGVNGGAQVSSENVGASANSETEKIEPLIPIIPLVDIEVLDSNAGVSTGSAAVVGSAASTADAPPPSKPPGPDTATKANEMLKDLRVTTPLTKTKPSPPKQRFIEVCNRVLSIYERPGESSGSIVWTGALVLIEYLAENESTHLSKGTRVLELGAGVGTVGVWCATLGAHVTVTDRPDAMDLLWANVATNAMDLLGANGATNAIQILANFGSCVARALSWRHPEDVSKLKESTLQSPLESDTKREIFMDVVVAADLVNDKTVVPLSETLGKILSAFDQAIRIFVCYKSRADQEKLQFGILETDHGVVLKEVGRGRGNRSDYSILSATRPSKFTKSQSQLTP